MNKGNAFSALILLSNLFIAFQAAFEAILLTNQSELNNCALLNFISVDIFLAKTFLILIFCLVVRNNS